MRKIKEGGGREGGGEKKQTGKTHTLERDK